MRTNTSLSKYCWTLGPVRVWNGILAEHQLHRCGFGCGVISGSYCKHCCTQDSFPWILFVQGCTVHLESMDDVPYCLVDPFNHGICLGISNHCPAFSDAIVIGNHKGKVAHEFFAFVKGHCGWSGISCQPCLFYYMHNCDGLFIRKFYYLEPSCSRVNHCDAP